MNPVLHLGIITSRESRIIFGNIKELVAINQSFFDSIETISSLDIVRIFLEYAELFIPSYSNYASNYTQSIMYLKTHKGMNRYLKKLDIGIHDLLITPIQRIPRYILFLNELGKVSPETPEIDQAKSSMQRIAGKINMFLEDHENKMKIWKIQNSFFPTQRFITPYRVFKRQGELMKLTRKGTYKKYKVFLFSGLLVYGRALPFIIQQIMKSCGKSYVKYILNRKITPLNCFVCSSDTFQVQGIEKSVIFRTECCEKDGWIRSINDSLAVIQDMQAPLRT